MQKTTRPCLTNALRIAALCLLPALPTANAQDLGPAVAIVEQAVRDGDVLGGAVLVVQNGKPLLEQSFGICDLSDRRPFENDTICWIASLTKPVTAAAALVLVDDGKLDLDATVESYLPEFRGQTTVDGQVSRVTVRQLLSHSSGIQASVPTRPSQFFDPIWLERSLKEIPPEIAKTKLEFQPGARSQYSNAAPYVMGRIVEIQSGQPFGQFVQSRILQPLGMQDTGFSIAREKLPRAAVVYRRERDTLVEFCRYDPEWRVAMTMPDGGLFSTPADIAKFATVFLKDGQPILSKQSASEMTDVQSEGFGLGWILDAPNQFSHWGSSGTLVWADRSTNTVGVAFFQIQDLRLLAKLHAGFREAVTQQLATHR